MKIKEAFQINPSSKKYKDYINYIDTSSVQYGRLDNVQHLVSDFPSRAQREIRHGDILYSSVRPNLRHYHLYTSNYEQIVGSSGFVLLRNKSALSDTRFVYYFLTSDSIVNYLSNIAELSQATFPSFSAKDIGKIDLPTFALHKQQKIASILSTYDALIENNTKRIRLLEQMAENLYKEWFVRFRFPGHENVEMDNGLPKGWKFYSLRELCEINKNTISPKRKDELIHYLDTSSITNNNIARYEDYILKDAPSRAKRVVKHNSIIFSTVRPNLRHLGILKNPVDNTIVSTGFAVFDCKYDIANILYRFLSSTEIVNYCQSIAEGAVATYPSIKPEEIARIKITLPSIEKAEYLNRQFETLISEQNFLTKQNQLLTRQRDLLLPRLMSGKLEVTV